jgi:metal-dependent hydrolase (beta-lactamase superfamily II)
MKPALKTFEVTPYPHPVSRLEKGGYDMNRIKTVTISHKHFDHFGNLDTISSFDPMVVVGPGSMEVIGKGYPETEKSPWPSSWLKDHRIFELPSPGEVSDWKVEGKGESKSWGKVACFEEAIDWFGDGSFWLINAPGVSLSLPSMSSGD